MNLGYSVKLVDYLLGVEKEITENTTYSFSITSDPATFAIARFELRFDASSKPLITVSGQTLTSSMTSGNQWYKDGEPIIGATTHSLEIGESGVYAVEVAKNEGCRVASDNVVMSVTGYGFETQESIRLHPNPTDGKVVISMPSVNSLQAIYLYDVLGNVIAADNDASIINKEEKTLDMSGLQSGVYIINLVSDKNFKSIRLIRK